MAPTTTVPDSPAPELDFDFDEHRLGRVSATQAILRHWFIALVPVVLALAAAGIYSARRAPTYTADTQVSTVSLRSNSLSGLPGVLQATQQLATTYSRAIESDAVRAGVASKLHISPNDVAGHVTASPVPGSPILKVEATANSEAKAIAIANASAAVLIQEVKKLGGPSPTSGILKRFAQSQSRLAVLQQRQAAAERAYNRDHSSKNEAKLAKAASDVQLTDLHLEALRQAYQNIKQAQASMPNAQIIATARTADSDRRKVMQVALFLGLLAGLAIGAALATLRANVRARRAVIR